jgi:molybdopterin/thiamine biosynthesis adenylyltransferase
MLDRDELERYARHIVLREVGGPGQAKLKAARVLVVGAGGLGAPVLLYLAAAGVGHIGVVDDDTVSLSNLQRQVIFSTSDIGERKVDGAEAVIARLNPHVAVEPHMMRLDAGNALALIARYDIVADGSDNFATRYLVSDACYFARSRWSPPRSAPSTARSPLFARMRRTPTAGPIRPIAACSPSRRRLAPCRPARRPASSARCRACSAR